MNLNVFDSLSSLFGSDYKDFLKYLHDELNKIVQKKKKIKLKKKKKVFLLKLNYWQILTH